VTLPKAVALVKPWVYCPFPATTHVITSRDQILPNAVGFIYKITNLLTGRIYIGRKVFEHKTKRKATLREKAAALALNTKSRVRVVRGVKDSAWASYWGSCDELKRDMLTLGIEHFHREILEFCCNKKYLNYSEVEHMIKYDVLRRNSYNGNIAGKFYRADVLNCPEGDATPASEDVLHD